MTATKIKILPEVGKMFIPRFEKIYGQEVGEQKFSYKQGYGQLSKAGATVQQGVTGHIQIDLMLESLSEDFYRETTNEVTNSVSTQVRRQLQESSLNKDYKNWWFAFLAGGSNNERSSEYYRNQAEDQVTIADTKYYQSAMSRMSSCKQKFHVSGTFDIVGQSYIETTVYLFIETLTVQTSDGTTITIPTQNTAVADADGNTGAGTTGSKINIVPLG